MNGMNKVIIMGYLGSDPKGLTSKDGKPYTSLSLATNRSWVNKEGGKEKRTDWHRVTVWGKKAQICQSYLKKGAPVCVEGYLSTYEVEEENGEKRWLTSVTAEDINFITAPREQAH